MYDISDDQIRVIGGESAGRHKRCRWWRLALLAAVALVILAAVALWVLRLPGHSDGGAQVYFDSTTVEQPAPQVDTTRLPGIVVLPAEADSTAGVAVRDTTVNDIPLRLYLPHGLRAALHVGALRSHRERPDVLMAMQAANIRSDNGGILGAFVLRGETLARGTQGESKAGFCSIINGRITLGVDMATPCYEQTIDSLGDFFRQYPLVADRQMVDNRVRNKAQRRALADFGQQRVVVVECATEESMHDFAQALADMGAVTAVNLIGGKPWLGWVVAGDSVIATPTKGALPRNVNYIIWTK